MAAPSSHISRISTRRVDDFHAWLTARYAGDHRRRLRARRRGFGFSAEHGVLGGLTAARSHYRAATVEVSFPSVPYLFIGNLRSGQYLVRWQGTEVRLAERGTILFPPSEYVSLCDGSDSSGVSLSTDAVLRVAEETSGVDRAQVQFLGLLPVSAAAEQQWLTTARFIEQGIYNLALAQPLLLAAAEQLAAAIVLATFPNTAMTIEIRTPRDPATAATVRRAVEFIDDHADGPITLTDIAIAVGVVPRTLQYAFRRHRDTTPLAYLRRVRLAQAHNELVAAQTGDGTTIAAVAARWGFRSNRFAAAYRLVYGTPPSRTLRS